MNFGRMGAGFGRMGALGTGGGLPPLPSGYAYVTTTAPDGSILFVTRSMPDGSIAFITAQVAA